MIFRLFRRNDGRDISDELYRGVTVAARNPVLYLRFGVPDTVEGRFESLVLHLVLVLRRLRSLAPPAPDIAQDLIDGFFRQLDASLREMGVGDMAVPKRMKKLAQAFYGRAAAYDAALDRRDVAALAGIFGEGFVPEREAALALARYAAANDEALGQASLDELCAARPGFVALEEESRG